MATLIKNKNTGTKKQLWYSSQHKKVIINTVNNETSNYISKLQ